MKFLKQNNINPNRATDAAISTTVDGTVVLRAPEDSLIEMQNSRAFLFPKGTSTRRPAPITGLARFNTDSNEFEGYNGLAWSSLGGIRDIDGDTYILAESFPGANENTVLFYTNGILSTSANRFGLQSKQLTTNQLEIVEVSPDGITPGDFKVSLSASENMTSNYNLKLPETLGPPGTFLGVGVSGQLLFESLDLAGNRVYCSAKVGNDNNDGILKPVKTLRRALQIASGLVYKRTFDYNEDICRRDVGLIIEAIGYDSIYNSNWQSVKAGLTYYNATAASVINSQKSETLAALQFLKSRVMSLGSSISLLSMDRYSDRLDDVIYIFDEGPSAAPAFGDTNQIFMENPSGADQGFINAKDNLIDNVNFIAEETVAWINAQIAGNIDPFNTLFTYDQAKCTRDTKLIVFSVVYDMIYGGNSQSRDAGLKYYDGVGDDSSANVLQIPGQVLQTVAALNRAKEVARQVAQNIPVTTTGVLTNVQLFGTAPGSSDSADRISFLFDLVNNIITNGVTFAPLLINPTAIADSSLAADRQILLAAKNVFADNVISFTSNYVPNNVKVTVAVASGEYNEANPLIIPDNVSVVGDGLRSCIIRPLNANKDMFKVRNACYFTEFTFRDKVNDDGIPVNTWNYAFSFDDPLDLDINRLGYINLPISKPFISTSPYIQNCSLISFLGGNGVLIDGNKVVTPNIPPIAEELEIPVNLNDGVPEQGKSFVANAFTMISFGGTGWRLINDAYAQLVSCFQIFMLNGTYCQSGGYVSITNSATNFGLYALRASGYSPNAFIFDRGYIAGSGSVEGEQTLKTIGFGRVPVNHFVLRFRNSSNIDVTESFKPALTEKQFDATNDINIIANTINIPSHGYIEKQEVLYVTNSNTTIGGLDENQIYYVGIIGPDFIKLFFDEEKTLEVDLLSFGSGTHSLLSNVEEFFVNNIIDSHDVYQELTLTPGSYSFVPGATITGIVNTVNNNAFVYDYNPITYKLKVSINKVSVGVSQERVLFTPSSTINSDQGSATNIIVIDAVRLTDIFSAEFTIKSTVTNNQLSNINSLTFFQLYLHRPSVVNSSSHTWEYAGSGIDYNALPQNGGKTVVKFEQFSELPGRVYTSGTNELGDFKVGDFIVAENKTGNISFRNKVIVSELTALKLSLSDIEIQALSIDTGLGDNEPGGAKNSRLSTQLAVRTFLKNRLGKFIDKDLSTNAVPGSVVQLNSSGQINPDLIPPTRNFSVNVAKGYNNRLALADDIPPVNVLGGDIASEEFEKITLDLDSPIMGGLDGELVTQINSGAQGYLIGNWSNSTTIEVGSVKGTFSPDFITGEIITVGDSTGFDVVAVSSKSSEATNYFLGSDSTNQFLILNTDYSFTLGNTITSVVNQAQGIITDEINGVVVSVNNAGMTVGVGYDPSVGSITYTDVPLTSVTGIGSGARADITVANGSISIVDIRRGGSGYQIGDQLSADYLLLGGVNPTTPFSIAVNNIENRLYIELIGNVKFIASQTAPDFIQSNSASPITITLTGSSVQSFLAPAASAEVNYTNSQILGAHSYANGDPVKYNPGANLPIGGILSQAIYYVKVITSTSIELYSEYSLTNKLVFTSDSTGTHTLTRSSVTPEVDRFVYVNHGLLTGDAVKIEGLDLSSPIISGEFFYIGGVTSNSFSLHTNRGEALNSVAGVSVSPVDISTQGSGTADITKQDVSIIGVVNTSSRNKNNWRLVNVNTIDASSIVSGTISTTRLANIGTANNETFLRGDSVWAPVVTKVIKNTVDSAISIDGSGDLTGFYNTVSIDVSRVDGVTGTPLFTNLGTARFLKEQFDIGTGATAGNVAIKNGVLDAGTLDGLDSSYFLNPVNLTSPVPIIKGGTGLTSYSTGDILFANSVSTFGKIAIGTRNRLLAVTEPVPGTLTPGWVNEISISSLTVDFTKTDTGATSVSSTTPIVVDSFDKSAYRSASYKVQISNLTDLSYQTINVDLVQNGNTVSRLVEFGSVATNGAGKGFFTTNIAGDNVRLIFNSFNNNSLQIKFIKTYIEF